MHQDDPILQQMALTEAEVSPILLKAPDSLPEKYRGKLIANTMRPSWHLKRKPSGKDAPCTSCFKTISEGELHIKATALWQPRDREQAINRNFRFCINKDCVSQKPQRSQLTPWNGEELALPWTVKLSDEDLEHIRKAEFLMKLKNVQKDKT